MQVYCISLDPYILHTFMNVYVASWIFTGVSIFIVYIRHMKKVEKRG